MYLFQTFESERPLLLRRRLRQAALSSLVVCCGLLPSARPALSQADSVSLAPTFDTNAELLSQQPADAPETVLSAPRELEVNRPPAPVTEVRTLKIGTNAIEPLVFLDEMPNSLPYGYSIDLWNTIADELNVTTEWVRYDSARDLLDGLSKGEVELAVAGLSITAAREANGYDFSQPFYESGLQLMVRNSSQTVFQIWQRRLFNAQVANALVLVTFSSMVVGSLIWVVEHKHNESFSTNPVQGVGQGMWFAIVTLGTFGYGDVTPVRLPGRLLACTWMGISFFIVADFIASMTVLQLNEATTSLEELKGEQVGVVSGTTAESYLRSKSVLPAAFEGLDDAAAALATGKIAGIVRDYPNLYHLVNTTSDFRLAGDRLSSEDYGMAVAEGQSPELLEAVNRELISLQEQGYLTTLQNKWFGETAQQ